MTKELVEKCLKDNHIEVIIPDAKGKPIYKNCHIVAKSASEIANRIIPIIAEEIKRELETAFEDDSVIFNMAFNSPPWHTFWERYKGRQMMVQPLPTKDDTKLYPEILYFAERVSLTGHQPVMKKVLPDGEPTELDPKPSQDLNGHDFDGFQWGYSGSSPAQLSLALLLDATSVPETALEYYQYFKQDQVSIWGDVWSIKRSEILRWLEVQGKKELESMANRN